MPTSSECVNIARCTRANPNLKGAPLKEVALRMATNPQLPRELTHGEAILMAKIDMRVDDLIISLRLFAGNPLADVAAAAIRRAVATAVGAKLAGDR